MSDDSIPGMKKKRRPRAADLAPFDADRLPPHDERAEMGVIGSVLLDPVASMGACMESFKGNPLVFYDNRHQAIWNVFRELHEANEGIDLITVQARLAKREVLEKLGGIAYLSMLEDVVPSAANLPEYLRIVREKWLLRQAVAACGEIVSRIYDAQETTPAEALLVEAESKLSALTEKETDAAEQPIKDVMMAVVKDMEEWHYTRGSQNMRGLPTGPAGTYLDKVLTGIRDTHYVVIAARPGEGKSAKALNIVEHLAEHHVWFEPTGKMVKRDGTEEMVPEMIKHTGIPVGIFSLEMDNESLGYRLVFGRAGVSEAQWNQGFAQKGDAERLVQAAHDLSKLSIYLDATPAQSIGMIAAKARRWVKQYGIKLFVLDYLQLAESDDPRDETRVRVNKISKKIMALKKQLGVPWIVLAQLNRNIETAERDRPPVLSDLAESGSIEQDADKVIIIKRTPRRDLELEKPGDEGAMRSDASLLDQICGDWDWSRRPRRVDMWVVKNRRGPTGKAEEVFAGNLCRFTDWHLFKVQHGVESRKEGESKHLAERQPEQRQSSFLPGDDEEDKP